MLDRTGALEILQLRGAAHGERREETVALALLQRAEHQPRPGIERPALLVGL